MRDLSSVRSVGGLLTADLLAKVSAGDPTLGGLRGADFHLAAGESPREAANRAWAYLSSVWPRFRDELARLPEDDPAVRVTRERWLLLVFRELGYGQLRASGGLTVADKTYPVSHLWGSVPIHLLGWGVSLDKRTRGVAGAADRAPHSMVQELLNRTDDYLWSVVSNGRTVRLLRDSTALSSQSYVEFDLEAIFDGELFADFVLFFLLVHESRLEVPDGGVPADCWLERWRSTAITQGTRALDSLRVGVQHALEHLGTGFLRAPGENQIHAAVAHGSLSADEFHQALLRLVYRLLFLFVAEDRGALLDPAADDVAKARYRDHYSTARLRRLALRRTGTGHVDLWRAQRLVLDRLGREGGCPELALPGIGGLFDDQGAEVLATADLPNDALLAAVRALSVVTPKGEPTRVVDYRNLGAEELGSIYESLLELVPRPNPVTRTFTLENLPGNDRKTTGSYYTPSALIDLVLDETLDPLLDDAERQADPEVALLGMTVCDPACGSGHFLVAAARRIAERLAAVRSAETDPPPAAVQDALADVIDRCIYGVDLNPLAAELAKVSLWLEGIRPGRPLSFLDAHIKVGNALLGTTPDLIAAGIPDSAYEPLNGDDKATARTWKRRNATERAAKAADQGELDLMGSLPSEATPPAPTTTTRPGAGLAEIHETRRRYQAWLASPELVRERTLADAWCAAFLQSRTPGATPITQATLDAIRSDALDAATAETIHATATQHSLFHWHLEFPEVFAERTHDQGKKRGGFTAIAGNPPWERIKLQEQEFFAQRDPEVASAANAAARKAAIRELTDTNPELAAEWQSASRAAEATSRYLRKSGRYPLCGVGDVNTYAVFAELFRSSIETGGRMGIITPTGLATDATTSAFFSDTVAAKRLAAFYDFENEAKIFPGVDHRVRFALTCMTGGRAVAESRLSFLTRHVRDAVATRFSLAPDEILMLNPNTGTLPMFRTRQDAEITLGIYRRHPVLVNDTTGENTWGLRFGTLFHMANDSGLFRTATELEGEGAEFDGWAYVRGTHRWLPLYEAKMLTHFDHRFSTYRGATQAQLNVGSLPRLTDDQHDDPESEPLARYWVAESDVEKAIGDRWDRDWLLGWRDITNTGNERTFVPSVLPRAAVGHVFPLALPAEPSLVPLLQAVWSSLANDYVARQKLSGTHMTYGAVNQLSAPTPASFDAALPGVASTPFAAWIRPRILELTYTSRRIAPYAADVLGLPPGADPGPPFRWVPERREQLRVELDAAMFHLYGLARDEVEHVMDSFLVVRKYEERDHGEFRTKRLILATYDAMADAAARGTVYTSPLDPPAGEGPRHPRDAR